jgi:predicted nucleotide-binding protein
MTSTKKARIKEEMTNAENGKRKYLSQADVPAYSLAKAIRVAQAIADNYGKTPTRPLRVAEAVGMQPTSSKFRALTGASIAYGLTDGGYNAEMIAITTLGKRIVSPTAEGDDLAARREALLRPKIIREFLTKYNGSRLPTDPIAKNVLEEMGVPADRADATRELILESAKQVGFLRDLKGQSYVDLDSTPLTVSTTTTGDEGAEFQSSIGDESETVRESVSIREPTLTGEPVRTSAVEAPVNNRVFITHGKNRDILGQLKELLTFGKLQPVVAVEHETVSKPVPDKVLDEMRSCAAAIIHVGAETKLLDDQGQEHRILNSNVLIEIGAALALYGRNFILLVEKGVTLPSNLQGLYEVRYEGDKLDYEATMKLLKAFNEFRK